MTKVVHEGKIVSQDKFNSSRFPAADDVCGIDGPSCPPQLITVLKQFHLPDVDNDDLNHLDDLLENNNNNDDDNNNNNTEDKPNYPCKEEWSQRSPNMRS